CQLADVRPGHRRPPDASRAGVDAVQVLTMGNWPLRFGVRRAGFMVRVRGSWFGVLGSLALVLFASSPTPRAPATSQQQTAGRLFRSGTELVLVNVVVRDKAGNVVRDLTRDDFVVAEDDKPQQITSFDFEELDKADAPAAAEQPVLTGVVKSAAPKPAAPAPSPTPAPAPAAERPQVDMRGRRLIVLFFDLSSMQPEEIDRAAKA